MFSGNVQAELTGADIPWAISWASEQGITFYDIRYNGVLSVRFQTSLADYKKLKLILKNKGSELKLKKIGGIYWTLKKMIRRPVLLACVVGLLVLTLWLPTRVLFIAIEGNISIPSVRILQQAEKCGIHFGAKRSFVRSEIVKNNLLEALPELQWAGINTVGCTAVISVREDPAAAEDSERAPYSSVVAARDGIIVSCTVTSGTPLCSVGQAVKEGQTLVSGYQDFGLLVKLTRSEAEIFAQTGRKLEVVLPLKYTERTHVTGEKKIYSLIVGKKRVNLSKDSGISYAGCDKMYMEYYLSLPGGFVTPLALAVERILFYEESNISLDPAHLEDYILDCADAYLLDQTVSGSIVSRMQTFSSMQTNHVLSAHYICVEMIGRERTEEIKIDNGENH